MRSPTFRRLWPAPLCLPPLSTACATASTRADRAGGDGRLVHEVGGFDGAGRWGGAVAQERECQRAILATGAAPKGC